MKNREEVGKIKRGIDILFGIIGTILIIPITIYVIILKIIYKDKSKIIYKQERIGKDGRIFKIYKYNTMIHDSEKLLEELVEKNEEIKREYKNNRKIKEDPRVTKVGRKLRQRNLDEFPQFINVLKGEMSLVGPRPYMKEEKKYMGKYYDNIIKVKPGLTGKWQVEKENNKQFEERLKIEEKYYKTHTIKEDIKIITETIKILLRG